MNRLSNMTRFGFNQERPIFWASSLELIGDWLDVQIELLFNIFRFLGTPGWDAQAVTWILVKNMCWDINFQLKNGCLMLWKTTLDLTLGWEWWKSKDQRHGQIAVWGLTCGLKRWPSKTTPWSILGAKTNDHRGVEICDSHNKTNQNPPIKEAVDQSIWKVKLFVPARGTSLESVICRFFVLTVKRVCCISGGFIGMIFKKWSEMIQNHQTNHQCHQWLPHGVLPWCPRFPIYEPFDLQLAGRLAAPHGDPEALAVLLKVRFARRRGGHVSTQKWLRIRQRDTSKHCVTWGGRTFGCNKLCEGFYYGI